MSISGNILDRLSVDVVACSDFGENRPFKRAAKIGGHTLLFNPDDDPIVVDAGLDLVAETQRAGYAFGLRFNCNINKKPVDYANRRSTLVEAFGGKDYVAVVMFDMELDKRRSDADRLTWQANMLDRWDHLRYARPTIYNVAALQDLSQIDYARMLRRNRETGRLIRKLAVQPYDNEMTPWDVRRVVDELVKAIEPVGGSRAEVMPVIDPANALHYLAGYDCETRGAVIFEAGRIPT